MLSKAGVANRKTDKSIYTTHEVGRLLNVSGRSVINWIEQSLLPSSRTLGGHRRIRRDDLLAFLRKHQIPTPKSLVQGNFKVLIVDDDQDIVDLVKMFLLRQGGCDVATASDGITALLEVGRAKPDLLILDIMIPGVNGIEVCRRIKGDVNSRTIIIAVSGNAEHENEILQAGADVFMAKPLDMERLQSEARRLLGSYRASFDRTR